MVGLGVSPSPPAPQVTYIQTHTVAVPMRSLQFSVHGWPFVRHGVVAGCEVHFAASKPPGRGYLCFGHQSGLGRYLLSLGLMGTPWTPTKPSHSDLWISSFSSRRVRRGYHPRQAHHRVQVANKRPGAMSLGNKSPAFPSGTYRGLLSCSNTRRVRRTC